MTDVVHDRKKAPFIPSNLRPDLTQESQPDQPVLSPTATKEQIAQAADRCLSDEERIQIRRGRHEAVADWRRRIPKKSPDAHSTELDGETILLNLLTGRYYTLNRVGTAIWNLCDGTRSVADMLACICQRFDVHPDRAHDDLVAMVIQLDQEGLLQQERG